MIGIRYIEMKKSKTTIFVLGISFFTILLLSSFASPAVSCINDNSPQKDGYKYPTISDSVSSENYLEWWYFELETEDFDMWFVYEIDNPDNVEGGIPKAAWLGTAILGDGIDIDTSGTAVDYGEFSASTETLDVNIDGNTIVAVDENTIVVQGYDYRADVTWDLVYHRSYFPSTPVLDSVPCGILPNDEVGYVVWMPRAVVSGTVIIGEDVFVVDGATGYHDHNWGDPITFFYSPWSKAQLSTDTFFIGGVVPRLVFENLPQKGLSLLYVDGEWKDLGAPTVDVLETTIDPETGFEYPVTYSLTKKTWKYEIDMIISDGGGLKWSGIETITEIPLFLLKSFHYEFSGTISKRGILFMKPYLDFDVLGSVEISLLAL
jgi:hypothetical protein